MKENETVIEKLCRHVKNAHDSKTPIIFIDTEEIQLVNRLAGRCQLVDLKPCSVPETDKDKFYYEKYIKTNERDLSSCENFSKQFSALKKLILNDTNNEPMLLLLHLTTDGTGNCIALLREYVNRFISNFDDNSTIRSSAVILYGNPDLLEDDLKYYTEIITPDYPTAKVIYNTIIEIKEKHKDFLNKKTTDTGKFKDDMRKLASEMRGFTLIETETYIEKMIRRKQKENSEPILYNIKECRRIILEARIQNLKRYGNMLEFYCDYLDKDDEDDKKNFDKIAGMKTFLEKADEIKNIVGENSDNYRMYHGTHGFKGALLVGVPGCGKSEAAMLLHNYLRIPMIRLDVGRLLGGLMGQSERNLREALRMAEEALAPCIVWIDEVEKAVSGATSSSNDGSGTLKRMFGELLTWLQKEKQSPCLVFATANDISNIPEEFIRNGRFDVCYGAFMPTANDCRRIFAEQMKRAERNRVKEAKKIGTEISPVIFKENCFADKTKNTIPEYFMNIFLKDSNNTDRDTKEIKFVSGADIAQLVNNAMNTFKNGELESPIEADVWETALRKAIEDPTFRSQGSSESGRNKIASCYVRLLRLDLVPVSAESLFPASDYTVTCKEGKITAKYADRINDIKGDYDKKFFSVIHPRINELAPEIERIEREKEYRR